MVALTQACVVGGARLERGGVCEDGRSGHWKGCLTKVRASAVQMMNCEGDSPQKLKCPTHGIDIQNSLPELKSWRK